MSVVKDNKGRKLREGESQRKDGRYMYRFTDLTGKRQTVYSWKLTEFDKIPKGKRDDVSLREKEEEINIILKRGNSIKSKKMSLNEVFDIYIKLKRHKGKPLSERTKENYTSEWNKNIRSTVLGHKKVADICRGDIISYYNELLEAGLSYGTVLFFNKVLNAVFNFAIDNLEIIDKNPCRRALNNIEGSQKETIPLTKAQDEALMEFFRLNDYELYRIYLVMRETMVRIGECVAITRSDIDTVNHTLTIDKQIIHYAGEKEKCGRLHISETKGRNVRKIPLKDNVFNVLMELVNSETTNQSIDGISGFLFSYKGKVYSPNALRKNMCDMVEKYNQIAVDKIEEFTPKTLRHTGCTMYSREGLDISVLQYILGHKSSYTTMRFYNHTTEERALYTFREHVEKSA